MRTIKFRAWDKNNKEMLDWKKIGTMPLLASMEALLTSTGLIFQQYTGLKDKNGKEIYEGDILLAGDTGQKERYRGPVVWQVTEFVVQYKNLRNKTWTALTMLAKPERLSWEVIGNIYENKELLNA